jgi:hypothetical protein
MGRITTTQLAEQIAALTDVVSTLVSNTAPVATATAVTAPKVFGSGIEALRKENGDTWKDFDKVLGFQLKKAQDWGKSKGLKVFVTYSYSQNRKRPFVMFGQKPRSGATSIATVSAQGKITDCIGGLSV